MSKMMLETTVGMMVDLDRYNQLTEWERVNAERWVEIHFVHGLDATKFRVDAGLSLIDACRLFRPDLTDDQWRGLLVRDNDGVWTQWSTPVRLVVHKSPRVWLQTREGFPLHPDQIPPALREARPLPSSPKQEQL